MSTHTQELAGIRERHNERQRKIDNAARAAAEGDNLAKLCHGRCKEHDDRASLLDIVDRVEEFAQSLERKGADCRALSHSEDRERLTAKASTYEAEARSLRAILEST